MNKKYLKDFILLGTIIVFCAVAARLLAGGETLEEYAQNNPGLAGTTLTSKQDSTIETADIESSSDVSTESAAEISASIETSVETTKSTSLSSEVSVSEEDNNQNSVERIIYQDGFYYEPISNEIFKRISGISYPVDCTVSLDELRYLVLQYIDFNGETQTGEMICNKSIAQDVVEIFYELYRNDYQIESVKLVDEFNGDDTASMLANNTSCFNYRVVEGTTRLSNHAKGLAIDLNPFYNPYITYNKDGTTNISPEGSEAYADRAAAFPYKIDESDLAYKLFREHGFSWGGNWNSVKDYQHFEKK